MKHFIFGILILISFNIIFGQIVYTSPEFATVNDSIIVYFDATQGNQGLMNYTGKVYTHTGVTLNGKKWQKVVGNWGDDSSQPELTRVNTDLYKLVIGNVYEFYNVNASDVITELSFVFRSAGNEGPTGRAEDGGDIFLSFFQSGITAVIDSPSVGISLGNGMRNPQFYDIEDEIKFKVKVASIGTQTDSIIIYKNGKPVKSVHGIDSIFYSEIATEVGGNNFEIIVSDITGNMDTVYFGTMVNGEIIEEQLPADVEPGINLFDGGRAVLALFAPYKEFVYLIGDFNDWIVNENYFMKKHKVSEDSVIFWYQFDNVSEKQVYQFQYLIDGNLRIADPFTEMILDPINDKYLTSANYPNMPVYPYNKTFESVATFERKNEQFQWSDENFVKPAQEELIIYEMLIRDFTEKHSYNAALNKLDYLDSLGINAIELMPTNEFEGNNSWGYNPSFYFAVDKYYGRNYDLKNFVNECHKRGIAVIGDMVLNHSYGESPLVRMYWNAKQRRPAADNPWYRETHSFQNPAAQWGYDFDHESKHTNYLVDRINAYWIEEFHFDGYRFDFTKGFTNKITNDWGSNYDASRIKILKRMADAMWSVDENAYVIFEHLAVNQEEKELADYGIILWGNMNHSYSEASMGWISNSDFSWGIYKSRGWKEPHLITYMESHDEERMMFRNLNYSNKSGDYNIKNLSTAIQRQKLCNAFFLTIPGPKMIWQFGELGYDYSINYDGRLGKKPVRWDYYDDSNRRNLYKTIKALLNLRAENEIFTSENTNITHSLAGSVKQLKMTGNGNVHIVGNFDVKPIDASLNFVHSGRWYDFFTGDSILVMGSYDINLVPGEFHIFSDNKFNSPEKGLLVKIDKETQVADKFKLFPAFPNPFNPITNISFTIPKQGNVDINIFNILGEKAYSKSYKNLKPGYHKMQWNILNNEQTVSSGVYFIQVQSKDICQNMKVVLLK